MHFLNLSFFLFSIFKSNWAPNSVIELYDKKRRKAERKQKRRVDYSPSNSITVTAISNSKDYMSIMAISNMKKRRKTYSRTTLMLMSVSTTFLVLHFPIAACKIFDFLTKQRPQANLTLNFMSKSQDMQLLLNKTRLFAVFKNVSQVAAAVAQEHHHVFDPNLMNYSFETVMEKLTTNFYYLSFTLNFFLYSLNGSRFRKSLKKMLGY